MAERFTPFYEWVAESLLLQDLKLPEALVLCRIKMWGNAGCYESYRTMGKKLKLSDRTVIRAVTKLLAMDLIFIQYRDKARQKRTLFFNFNRTGLPLIDGKPMSECHRLEGKEDETYDSLSEAYDTQSQEPMTGCHTTISSTIQDKTKETVKLISDLLTTQAKPLTKAEKNKRKQMLRKQLSSMTK